MDDQRDLAAGSGDSDPGVLTIRRQIEVLMEGKHLREAIGDVFAD